MSELKVYHHELRHNEYEEFYLKYEADKVIADLEESHKMEVEQLLIEIVNLKAKNEWLDQEVKNYRRHANECEGMAAQGDIDKVSLLEEIKDVKNDNELLESELCGFLQLEEECGGGDLRKYIAHQKYKRCLAMADMCDEVMMSCELRGYAVHRIWANRHQWAMRWKYRWLELAEKFKDE